MNRLFRFFKSRSFAILLFHVGVLLFNWPLLSMANEGSEAAIFSYLLITWAVVVCLLIIVGSFISSSMNRNSEE